MLRPFGRRPQRYELFPSAQGERPFPRFRCLKKNFSGLWLSLKTLELVPSAFSHTCPTDSQAACRYALITGLQPALTLGCGAVGGSATSDNVGPMHLIDIRRVAFGLEELSDLRAKSPASCCSASSGCCASSEAEKSLSTLSREDIEAITRAVLARLGA